MGGNLQKVLLKSRKVISVILLVIILFSNIGSGLIRNKIPTVEAAQATIDADAAINGTSHLQSGAQTVFVDDQNGYKFFRDALGYCVYRKTTNGGTSWGATTTVDAQTDCIQIQVWYDKWTPNSASSSIHIATLDTSAGDIFYNRLDVPSDTLLLSSNPVDVSTNSGNSVATIVEGANTTSITRGTDGTLYATVNDASDSYVVECTINCNLAGSWTETGTNPLDLANDYDILVPLASGNIMVIDRDISLEDMRYKIWNNSTWSATWTTFDANATDNTVYDVGMAVAVSSTTPGNLYLAYIARNATLGTDDQVRGAKFNGSTWATTTDILTTTTRGLTNVAIGIDAANDDVYVAYTGRTTAGTANTGRVYYKWATSTMMNWSTEVGPLDTTQDDFYGLDINSASDQRLYLSWFDNTDDDIYGDTIADVFPGIHATTTGTQTASVNASTSNFYVGGKIVITENYKQHDVTGVVITENGTVDASTALANIKLQYDADITAPYDCASESFGGGESQFGTTDTDGFSGANGTSTFTGTTITVSTTSALCLYPVMDVRNSAVSSSTIEILLNNPATDITVTNGIAGPPTAKAIAGTTIIYNDNVTLAHYHWRRNDGTEASASSATGNEDTLLTQVSQNIPYRLRVAISNEGSSSTAASQYRLEYAQKITSCSSASGWTDVGSAVDAWDMASSQLIEGSDTTNIAVATGGVTNENTTFLTPNGGQRETSSQTGNIILTTSQYVELEYAIKATASSIPAATYCFRVTASGDIIDNYLQYPEATIKNPTDFFVQRGVFTMTGTTFTITAGVDYVAPSASTSAFVRITNTHNTGAGDTAATGNQFSSNVTSYITNPSNIMTSVTFARGSSAVNDTRVAWEIVEYIGSPGGENEIIVRQQGPLTYVSTELGATTTAVSGIVDDTDVVVFITGQFNPDTGRTNYNTGLSTASWNSSADTATFRRGEAGADAVGVSYAIVEFIGSNWAVQRTPDHAYSAPGVTETEAITALGSLSRAFIHTQKRVGTGLNQHEDFGHEVWLSSIGQVSFRLDPGANTVGSQVSVAWVIENTQTTGDTMLVTRSNGTSTGGTAPLTINVGIGATLDDLSVSSIFINNRASGALNTYPEPMIAARLISTTTYELWVSNTGGNRVYQTEIVEWPTALRKITQNYYRLYVNNNELDPTDPWPAGGVDLGENTEVTGLDTPIASGGTLRIRMSLQISSGAMIAGVDSFKLQFAPRNTTCSAIATSDWLNLGNIGSTTALWRATSTPITDGTPLSTDPPAVNALNLSVSDVSGTFEEENDTAFTPFIVAPGEDVEYDWAIQDNGATDKTSYCFRMIESNGTSFLAYNFYPTIRTVGYGAQSQDWRWFDDAENETPTVTLAATNTAPIDIDFNNLIKLRMTLREVNGAPSTNTKFRLQFSESSSFSTTTNVEEIGSCTNLSYWCYADGGGIDNATITTRTIGDADTCTGGSGNGCGMQNESGTTTSSFVHNVGAATEFSFTIRSSGARANRVYYFRVYDVAHNETVPLGSGEVYPSLVTKGASLVFTMQGLASSTVIEGVTLDVDSTPTTIAYGSIPVDTMVEAGHRLAVDTNGTQGHQIFMMMTGDLLSSGGAKINPITGTNEAPTAWNTGCAAEATSCFGYHTGDDTLQGGSTRFSAIDTYARMSTTTPEEVSYNSQPVAGEVTDIVFRLFRRQLQDAGQYESSIMYISVPMF